MVVKILSLVLLCCISIVFAYILFRARLRDLPREQKMIQEASLKGLSHAFSSLRAVLYSPFGVRVSLLVMFVVFGGLLLTAGKMAARGAKVGPEFPWAPALQLDEKQFKLLSALKADDLTKLIHASRTENYTELLVEDMPIADNKLRKVIEHAEHNYIREAARAGRIGSYVDRGDRDFLLLRASTECSQGNTERCIEFIKAVGILSDLTDHPEYADYNYRVQKVVDSIRFERSSRPSKVWRVSEELLFNIQNVRDGWDDSSEAGAAKRRFVVKIGPGMEKRRPEKISQSIKVVINDIFTDYQEGIWTPACFATKTVECCNFLLYIDIPQDILRKGDGRVAVKIVIRPVEQLQPFSQVAFETERMRQGVDELEIRLVSDEPLDENAWMSYRVWELPTSGYKVLSFLEVAKGESDRRTIPGQKLQYEYSYREKSPKHAIIFWPGYIRPENPPSP